MTDLLTFGEPLSVFIAAESEFVSGAKYFLRTTSGAELNVAITVRRLGLKSQYFARFGDDQPSGFFWCRTDCTSRWENRKNSDRR